MTRTRSSYIPAVVAIVVTAIIFAGGMSTVLLAPQGPDGPGNGRELGVSWQAPGIWILGTVALMVGALVGRLGTRAHRARIEADDAGAALRTQARTFETERSKLSDEVRKRSELRRSLLSANERLNSLLESARHVGIVATDETGIINFFNRGAENLLGFDAAKMIGHERPERFHDPASLADASRPNAGARTENGEGGMFVEWAFDYMCPTRECALVTKTGDRISAEYSVTAMRAENGRLVGYLHVFSDLTDRIKLEQELATAQRRAEKANEAKSRFLANLSHELKTPLNAIIGYSDMLLEEGDALSEQVQSDVQKINGAGKRLLQLILDIIEIARLDGKLIQPAIAQTMLSPLIRNVVSSMQGAAEDQSNSLDVFVQDEDLSAETDGTKIERCLKILLSNACKYTQSGRITVRAERRTFRGEEVVSIRVEDTGPGIAAETLDRLFAPFDEGDVDVLPPEANSGLGLQIARRTAVSLGGGLHANSEPGKGSTFVLWIPSTYEGAVERPREFSSQIAGALTGTEDASPEDSGIDVAFLSNSPNAVNAISATMNRANLTYQVLPLSEESLEDVAAAKPQMVLHDLVEPGTAAWDVVQSIRADSRFSGIPIVMLSRITRLDAEATSDAPMVLSKPVDKVQLLNALKPVSLGDGPVLVVDDDVDARVLVRRMLTGPPEQILEASNGLEALEVLKSHKPSVILLDLMMPEMNGFTFLKTIRQQVETRSIPVVVMTSKDLSREERDYLRGYVEQLIDRPATPRESLENVLSSVGLDGR